MVPYREEVRKVLDLLAYMLLESDPDGLDVYYTSDREKLKRKNHFSILKDFNKHPFNGTPDMRERIADILARYREKLGKKNNFITRRLHKDTPLIGPRRLNLYVLTDAVWQPKTTLTIEIQTLVSDLLKHGLTNKQIGIQFIRFGNDGEGIERLNRLDADMKLQLYVLPLVPNLGSIIKRKCENLTSSVTSLTTHLRMATSGRCYMAQSTIGMTMMILKERNKQLYLKANTQMGVAATVRS